MILAGVCAAVHMGKLPPAITALQGALGMSLMGGMGMAGPEPDGDELPGGE